MTGTDGRGREIEKKIEDFGGLIDEQTARLLLDYEQNRLNEERIEKLKARLEKMTNSHEEGVILEVDPVRTYSKRNGNMGRLLGIRVGLIGGKEAKIVFWDSQIEEVDVASARTGERIVVSNCILTDGKYGLTIGTGKGGSVRLLDGRILYPANKK